MNDLRTEDGASLTGLVSGIVHDVQTLIQQQVALVRTELHESVQRTKQGAILALMGGALLALGGLMGCFMLVHLLAWAAPSLPLWACYLIVGALLLIPGGGFVAAGLRQFSAKRLMPDQSAEAVKENWQWLKNPK